MLCKAIIALGLFLISRASYAAEPLGQFPDLPAFKGTDYAPVRLQELGAPKVWVLYFSSVSCPVAQRYTGVLIDIEKSYAPRGAQFVAVNVSPADSVMDMAQYALEYGVRFPVVKDTHGEAAKQLGITRTPEVAVLDAEWRLLYRGRRPVPPGGRAAQGHAERSSDCAGRGAGRQAGV
jgi:peroxiredoxin